MYQINDGVEVTAERTEANFDRACDEAYSLAIRLFGISEDGHSQRVLGWERFRCWIELTFDVYQRVGNTHFYTFRAYARKEEESEQDDSSPSDNFSDNSTQP